MAAHFPPPPADESIRDLTKIAEKHRKSFDEIFKGNQLKHTFPGTKVSKEFLENLGYKVPVSEKEIRIKKVTTQESRYIDIIIKTPGSGLLLKTREPEVFLSFPETLVKRMSLDQVTEFSGSQIAPLNTILSQANNVAEILHKEDEERTKKLKEDNLRMQTLLQNNALLLTATLQEKDKMSEKLNKNQLELDGIREELTDVREEIAVSNRKNVELGEKLAKLQSENEGIKNQITELSANEQVLKHTIDYQTETIRKQKDEIAKLTKELETYRLENLKITEENKKLNEELTQAKEEINSLREEINLKNKKLQEALDAAKGSEVKDEQETKELREAPQAASPPNISRSNSTLSFSSSAPNSLLKAGSGPLFFFKPKVKERIKTHTHVTLSVKSPIALTPALFQKITNKLNEEIDSIQKSKKEDSDVEQDSFDGLKVDPPKQTHSSDSYKPSLPTTAKILRNNQDILNISYQGKAIEIVSSKTEPADDEMYAMVLAAKIAAEACGRTQFMIEHCEESPETAFKLYLIGKSMGLTPIFKDANDKQNATENGILRGNYSLKQFITGNESLTIAQIYQKLNSREKIEQKVLQEWIANLQHAEDPKQKPPKRL